MKALYRIVNAVVALIIIPVIIFTPLIRFQISPKFEMSESESQSMIGQFLDGIGLGETLSRFGLEEEISLSNITDILTGKETFWYGLFVEDTELDIFTGDHGMARGIWKLITGQVEFSESTLPDQAVEKIDGRLAAVACGFVIAILAAIFVFVWSIISNKRLPVLLASIGGMISTIVMICSFNSIGNAFERGAILITEFIPAGSNWLMSFAAGFIGVDRLEFAGFHTGMMIVFIALVIWSISYYIIEIGETPEEKAQELKKEKERKAAKAKKKAEKEDLKAKKQAEKALDKAEKAKEEAEAAEKAMIKAEKAKKKAEKAEEKAMDAAADAE